MNRLSFRKTLPLVLTALLLVVSEARAETAQEILDATGVKGGLVVHVGCGDGKLTAALRTNDSYLVQGLDKDAANVAKARQHIRSLKLYGKVTVDRFVGGKLPYTDNLVNLVVCESADISAEEVSRVLCPLGVAYVKKDGKWTKTVKPRPKEIDVWTHYLHDADNNAVAHDSVIGPLGSLQWIGSPKWARHHDRLASMSAMVSTENRIFYIMDEGPRSSILLPPRWRLVARDAFNGTILWKRDIKKWFTHMWPLKSGPAVLPRRLVAVGDTVFATLHIDAPLSALDAATGKTIRTYKGTAATEEVLYSDNVLFLVVNKEAAKGGKASLQNNSSNVNKPWWSGQKKEIMAVSAESGEILWQKNLPVIPLTLTLDTAHVFFHDGKHVICLDRKNGDQKWKSEPIARVKTVYSYFAPTLLVQDGVVLFAGGEESGLVKSTGGATKNDTLTALAADTGKKLWSAPHPPSGYSSPEDVFVTGGLVWYGATSSGRLKGTFTGRDLRTGEVKNSFDANVQTYWFHHRCYRGKATDRFLLASRTGIEFVDPAKKNWTIHHWVRGGCLYGILPCNGLIYAPPHACACYLEAKQYGFSALAPAKRTLPVPKDVPNEGRLEKGPAFGQIGDADAKTNGDWPTYRHDPARSGKNGIAVPTDLKQAWKTDLGSPLTSVVVAGGKLFVASIDTHTVHALDASDGKKLWSYTTGGRVDSPPTIHQGMALFGSADGWVYCLRASDGKLVWRFRAAPVDRRLTSFEQVESIWPVHGSVLVQDGIVYCIAGRSMFLDGGLRFLKLDPKTGKKLAEKILDNQDPETGKDLQDRVKWLNMPAAQPDVLSSDGKHVFMRSQRFDLDGKRLELTPQTKDPLKEASRQSGEGRHIFCPTGFLDGTWYHRSYWMYGKTFSSGWKGYYLAGTRAPAGKILVVGDDRVFGFGRKPQYFKWTTPLEHQLFCADMNELASAKPPVKKPDPQPKAKKEAKDKKGKKGKRRRRKTNYLVKHHWKTDVPILVRAMVLADKDLIISGPPDLLDETKPGRRSDPAVREKLKAQIDAFNGKKGGLVWVVSRTDGKKKAEYKLGSPPTFDGMALANGKLYFSAMDGSVVCFAGE